MANKLRKLINKVGIDLHRYRREANRLGWLTDTGIRSVFDVGANVGQFAGEIREILPNAQIYSFEPLKECFDALNKKFRADARFKSFNIALGEKEESLTINKSSYTPSSSLLPMADSHKELYPHTKDSTSEQIKVRRLDDLLAEIRPAEPFLLKVDTQGYEAKVIAGGANAFKKAAVVLIEASYVELYDGQPLFDDIYQKMKGFGLTYQAALHQKLDTKTGKVIFEDAIFVRG